MGEYNFPELKGKISGQNYPIPPFAIACIFFGESIWNYVPFVRGVPSWYGDLKKNPAAVMIFVFLIGPSIIQSFVTTGAFEVELDGQVLYSKLQTGRLPTGADILTAFTAAGLKRN